MFECNLLWSRYNPKDKDELHLIAVEKGLKEYDVALDAGSRRYDLRITAIK